MASEVVVGGERAGAEIVYGAEECYQKSVELLEELGFPKGVMPLKNLVECGRVRSTGYVWMKQNTPYEHFFESTNTRVSYALEVTAYVDKCCMKKMTGNYFQVCIAGRPGQKISVALHQMKKYIVSFSSYVLINVERLCPLFVN